jgi:hypothetical protein
MPRLLTVVAHLLVADLGTGVAFEPPLFRTRGRIQAA